MILLSNLTLSNPQQQREAAEGETEEEALLLERAVSAARATLRRETAEAAAREAARCEEAERVQRLKVELAAVEAVRTNCGSPCMTSDTILYGVC